MRIAYLGARFPSAVHPPYAGGSRASVRCGAAR